MNGSPPSPFNSSWQAVKRGIDDLAKSRWVSRQVNGATTLREMSSEALLAIPYSRFPVPVADPIWGRQSFGRPHLPLTEDPAPNTKRRSPDAIHWTCSTTVYFNGTAIAPRK
ncbi:MAG: hypothetical protein RLZZ399_1079 [Verrucomicrobiota bacterium]|jgi:hypothetical protein